MDDYMMNILGEVTFPKEKTIINSGEFANDEYISKVYIHSGIKEIKSDAFNNCKNLSEIVFESNSAC